jgi:hypothetical protein
VRESYPSGRESREKFYNKSSVLELKIILMVVEDCDLVLVLSSAEICVV